MAERARRITADRLGERLPVEDAEDELGQLTTVFNATLARLERSFAELRRSHVHLLVHRPRGREVLLGLRAVPG
jgi:nitrate/nitrite-specific signal transduction histidine kinase